MQVALSSQVSPSSPFNSVSRLMAEQGYSPVPSQVANDGFQTAGQGPRGVLAIAHRLFPEVRTLREGLEFDKAAEITKNNGLDEIYFADKQGNKFVVAGKGLKLNGLKEGYVGTLNGREVEIKKIDNEVNTAKEGAFAIFNFFRSQMTEEKSVDAVNAVIAAQAGAGLLAFTGWVGSQAIGGGGATVGVASTAAVGGGVLAGMGATLIGFGAVTAATMAGGALYGLIRRSDSSSILMVSR